MTTDELRALIPRISYRPSWTLTLMDGDAGPLVRLSFKAPDATGRVPELDLRLKHALPPAWRHWDEGAVLRFIFAKILEFERHESREWFKVDGVPVDYPHGPTGELLP